MAKRTSKKKKPPIESNTAKSSTAKSNTAKSNTAKSNTAKSSTAKSSTAKSSTAKSNLSAAVDEVAIRKILQRLEKLDRDILAKCNRRVGMTKDLAELHGEVHSARLGKLRPAMDGAVHSAVERNEGPLDEVAVRSVFRELISGCREQLVSCRVAFLGPSHSYSYLAAVERFGQSADFIPVGTIAAVFSEVEQRNADFGLVPLENSTDGRIADTLDMFTRISVKISSEVPLRIHHQLIGNLTRAEIRQVCSKPQALSQCRNWIAQHLPQADVVETSSTAAAAKMAAENEQVAAVASRQAAANFGLKIVARNIEDNPRNITRFAVIGLEPAERTRDDKTSLLFQLPHQPGALAGAMAVFRRGRLNLTWIESFPKPGSQNEYFFFVELQGHYEDQRVRRAVDSLKKKTERLEVLGSYPRRDPIV